MTIPEVQQARDYNRGLPAPIRWVHVAAAFVLWMSKPVRLWMNAPGRRAWARPLVLGLAAAVVAGVFDGALSRAIRSAGLWRPDLAGLLSYGVVLGSVVAAAAMWLQRPANRGRVIAWAVGAAVTLVMCRAVSMTVGRPRPRFEDPGYFINPLGSYPVGPGLGIRHAWEFWGRGVWDLWSIPSVEAGWAVVGAAVIGAAYPRVRALAWIVAGGAGLGVVITGLGYASDVAVGMALGAGAAGWSLQAMRPKV
jgi:hypothetical protein